jgi:N-acyl-D-amino-acid deacylase
MTEDFDILIRDAWVVDGENHSFKGSIGIRGGRIAAVGEVMGSTERVIDASSLTAVPGFVDSHSHADWGLPWYPNCESAVMQGCTTVIAGQCGGSPAPLREYVRPPRELVDEVYERRPYLYHAEPLLTLEEVNEMMGEKYGWTIDWRTIAEFFSFVEGRGISINYAPLVGHGTVRYAVMGEDYKRHSTEDELGEMESLIRQAMEEGCIGMSTGLDYDPDVFASREEIEACVSVLKPYDGIYCPHWRRTGRRRDVKMGAGLAEPQAGIDEVVETCRRTGVRLNIAHIAPGYHTIPPMPPEVGEAVGRSTLRPVDAAIEEGLPVSFDCIPWPCWEPLPYLSSLHFTQWLRLLGSRRRLAEWLRVEEFRLKAWEEIESGKLFQRVVINPCLNSHWAENFKIVSHSDAEYSGLTLAEAAARMERDPWNALCDLIIEDPDSRASHTDYRGIEEQMKVFFRHSYCTVGLDVSVTDNKWEMRNPPYAIPLPDTYSGYPKFLIRYVRDGGLLSLEEAVRKCSTLPARFHDLKDRGVIRPGAHADITLIDMSRLRIVGNPEESRSYPEGIPHVIVNGEVVVEDGEHTGARPGMILKRPS